MIKIILSSGLFVVFLYSLKQTQLFFRLVMNAVLLTGLVFVWRPDLSIRAANLLGVGRGADLIFYLWTVITFIILIHFNYKLKKQRNAITEIVRKLAIDHELRDK